MNRTAKFWMVAALMAVVVGGFRVSWNALKDVARAIGADPTAAVVYPLVVDGLMALALVATLVLQEADRRFALRVLAGYTLASLVLNYVHGLVPQIQHGDRVKLAEWSPANWVLVLLATSLPVGSIFFGSDLVAKVLHHTPARDEVAEKPQVIVNRSTAELPESTSLPSDGPDGGSADPASDPAAERPEPTPQPQVPPKRPIERKPRTATGPVPPAARTPRRIRTAEELLTEARELTVDWPDSGLTSEAIRIAMRISPANARMVRDAIKAERGAAHPPLHVVPAPDRHSEPAAAPHSGISADSDNEEEAS